jgi:hypothetical protein
MNNLKNKRDAPPSFQTYHCCRLRTENTNPEIDMFYIYLLYNEGVWGGGMQVYIKPLMRSTYIIWLSTSFLVCRVSNVEVEGCRGRQKVLFHISIMRFGTVVCTSRAQNCLTKKSVFIYLCFCTWWFARDSRSRAVPSNDKTAIEWAQSEHTRPP